MEFTVIGGKPPKFHLNSVISDSYVKSDQLQRICKLFYDGKIKPGDIFVFTDGWNYAVLPIKYMSKIFDLDVKFIGFWGDSYFTNAVGKWKKMVYSGSRIENDWAKHFEKGLLQSYHWNLFKDNTLKSQFFFRYKNLMQYQKWAVSGFPYEYIWERGLRVEIGRKENIVLCPWPLTKSSRDIFDALSREFPGWKFIYVLETEVTRENYLQLLTKAKIVFSCNKNDVDLTNIFECLCYGCYPLIISSSRYKNLIADRYRYPKELIDYRTKLKFIRNKFAMQDRLQQILDNYSVLCDSIRDDAQILKEMYYTNSVFLNILDKCQTKN
jgi:hypothetical protein